MSFVMLEILLAPLLALSTLGTALFMVRSMKKLGRRAIAHRADRPSSPPPVCWARSGCWR
jgi:hypothetical protein